MTPLSSLHRIYLYDCHPKPGHPILPPSPGEKSAYPWTSSSKSLSKGLKLHLLVMTEEFFQGSVAEGVSGDKVTSILELVDDEVAAAITAPVTQLHVDWVGLLPASGPALHLSVSVLFRLS